MIPTIDAAAAFPTAWRSVVSQVVPPGGIRALKSFEVSVGSEIISIPYRIYSDDLEHVAVDADTPQATVRDCLASRHHDGFVRQRHLRELLRHFDPIVVPYVVQLTGEYVLEILQDIADWTQATSDSVAVRTAFGEFLAANPSYYLTTTRRITSYWSCYYRLRYPLRSNGLPMSMRYPGFVIVEWFEEVARLSGLAVRPAVPRLLNHRS